MEPGYLYKKYAKQAAKKPLQDINRLSSKKYWIALPLQFFLSFVGAGYIYLGDYKRAVVSFFAFSAISSLKSNELVFWSLFLLFISITFADICVLIHTARFHKYHSVNKVKTAKKLSNKPPAEIVDKPKLSKDKNYICPKCNTKNREGSKFCKKCGNKL